MAQNADSVIVELIAKNDQFDANVRQSSTTYQQSMRQIETSGTAAETSHKRLTASVGNSRIAMLEFGHIARGTADQIAAGAPLTQVLAQHMGMLGQAVSMTGGVFGRFGAFLGGPWGLALTVAAAGVATLILRHKEENDTVEEVLKKRMKMHEQTLLNKQADEAWSHTLEGLIESLQKTNDELGKRLKLQPVVDQQALQSANATLLALGKQLNDAETNGAPEARLANLRKAFSQAVKEVYQQTLIVGDAQGAALNDMNKRVDEWIALQQNHLRYLQGAHPELLGSASLISGAFDALSKALSDAAQAGVPIGRVTSQVGILNDKLAESPSFIKEYVAELKRMAAQLEDTVSKAKNAPKAIEDFKKSLIGAEGTGTNRMGSSAAGFGQFMPDTFLHYFKQAYPGQAGLPRDAILDQRNNRQVAEGVIDTATDDYVQVLKTAGQQITAAALYTMHLLSAGDPRGRTALRLLNAPADESTSSFLSAGVLRGNPFLQGTAGSARSAIARRIGDSSGAVTQGAVALQTELLRLQDQMTTKLAAGMEKEQEVTVAKEGQAELSREILANHTTLESLIDSGILPSLKEWEREYDQIKDSQKEVTRFGEAFIDDVLNPDNWRSWGDIGKTVLRDLESEFIRLAAINPLKNLLFGQNNPTLGSVFSLFGGGGGFSSGQAAFANDFATLGFASGGRPPLGRPSVVGENGPELFVPDSAGTIIPNGARAAVSGGGGGPAQVFVGIEASEYFDGRVLRTTGPVMAQVGASAANGGATIARRNLGRESQHRLE